MTAYSYMTASRFAGIAFWLGVVVLALAAQPLFADDDNGSGPLITDVFVDEGNGVLVIVGEGFTPDPIVTLSIEIEIVALSLVSVSPIEIVALLPSAVAVGDHLLTVTTVSRRDDDDDDDSSGGGSDDWDLTFGAVGPQGQPGPPGCTASTRAVRAQPAAGACAEARVSERQRPLTQRKPRSVPRTRGRSALRFAARMFDG